MKTSKNSATGTNPAPDVTDTLNLSRRAIESEDMRLSKALSFSSLTITAAIISLSLGLAACQPKNGAAGASGPTGVSAAASPAGTGDSGGGNGLDGKFFEAYVVNPEQTPAWQTYMNPILENLAYLHGAKGENAMWLVMGARAKRWYIAPIKLATLTKEQIGVDFIRDPIQQLALQTDREIWFDKAAYDSNPPTVAGDATCPTNLNADQCAIRNRAIGLLHETMVSLYMMQFMTMTDVCAKYSQTPGGCAGIERIEADPAVAPKPKRALDKNDYANIRTMTSWMFENGATVKSNDEVKMQFLRNGFDARMYYLEKIENHGSTQEKAAEKITFTREELGKALVDATTLSKLPTICRSRVATQISSVNCALKFATSGVKNDVLEMSLSVGVGSANPVQIRMAVPAAFLNETSELHNFWLPGMKSVGYMTFLGTGVVEGQPIKVGTDTYQVIVFFSEDKTAVRGIFLWQQRVTKLTPRPADEEKIMDAMVPGAQHVGYEWATPGETVLNDLQFVDSEFFSNEFYTLPGRSGSGAVWVKGGQNVR